MNKPKITYSLAMAAGRDAGNRSMREGRRTQWAVKDWNVACETFERLWGRSEGGSEAENVSEHAQTQKTATLHRSDAFI